jgi:hypothetical protein
MSIASLLSIKVTSPITHMVSSAVRGVVGSVLGVWLFKDVITTYVHHPLCPVFGGPNKGSLADAGPPLRSSFADPFTTPGSSTRRVNRRSHPQPPRADTAASKRRTWSLGDVVVLLHTPASHSEPSVVNSSLSYRPPVD